jgi:hypothetical protein
VLGNSYSFSSELQDEWDWTERYPSAAELVRYFEHVADRVDLMTSGFPNMFTETGPGSPGPLANVSIGVEQHADWIDRCIAYIHRHGHTRIDTRPETETAWMELVRQLAERTLFPKANS